MDGNNRKRPSLPRAKITLNKYESVWDGKVLRYLLDSHPGKKEGDDAVMDLVSAAWLPFTMRRDGVSDDECREAALYSVRYLLSHACSLVSDFGLSSVAISGLVADNNGATVLPTSNSMMVLSNENLNKNRIVEIERDEGGLNVVIDEEEDDSGDDGDGLSGMLSFPDFDAGLRS